MEILKGLLAILTLTCAPAAGMAAGVQLVSNRANVASKDYVNPVIHADYSDPDAVATPDGTAFYMTASSFQCVPGLPILKSNDLVNWNLVNYALDAVPPVDFYGEAPRHGKGVWAPCIREHNGEYYIYWGDPDFGIYMIKTDNPEGEWSEPVLVVAGKGLIDPSPLWDEDGRVYLSNGWAASRAGFNSVLTVRELSVDGTRAISAPVIVFDGNDGVNHTVEGSKLYKKDGYYYMFAPAGGVATGWQLVMRSSNIYGPYESKIVMAQGKSDINGPHQGAWVDTPDGKGWFLHFQDKGAYGRVIHLNPLKWVDGWPVIGEDADGDGCGDPVRKHKRPMAIDGNKKLAFEHGPMLYQWHGNYNEMFGFPLSDGGMRIYGHKISDGFVNLWEVPNMWLEKFPAERFSITATIRVSAKANADGVTSGMIVMGWDYCALEVEKRGDDFVLKLVECNDAEQGGKEKIVEVAVVKPSRTYAAGLYPNMELDMQMRLIVKAGGVCSFSYSTDGGEHFTRVPGEFKARAGKWIGAKTGFFSITPPGVNDRGWIDVISTELTMP